MFQWSDFWKVLWDCSSLQKASKVHVKCHLFCNLPWNPTPFILSSEAFSLTKPFLTTPVAPCKLQMGSAHLDCIKHHRLSPSNSLPLLKTYTPCCTQWPENLLQICQIVSLPSLILHWLSFEVAIKSKLLKAICQTLDYYPVYSVCSSALFLLTFQPHWPSRDPWVAPWGLYTAAVSSI